MEHPTPEQRESLWRSQLSASDRAEWRGQPELEQEARLTDALAKLPDAPVPSNFTARVLAAIDLDEAQAARSRANTWRWSWHWLLPRFAVTATVLLVAGVSFHSYQAGQHRTELARSLSTVTSTPAMPSVETLENLDAIQRMSQPAHADTELLAALQ